MVGRVRDARFPTSVVCDLSNFGESRERGNAFNTIRQAITHVARMMMIETLSDNDRNQLP